MGVYRVAVCDDERAACEEVCRLCDDILTQDGIPHRIVPFSSASALDACLREGDDAFDLLVLDIAMQGQSGMELAHELRRRRDRVSIVFVTGCEEYLEEGYGVQPVHFLLKPVTRERLSEALHADRELNHSPKTVTLQRGGRLLRLALSDIYYVETGVKHNVKIVTPAHAHLFPASLSYMEQALPAEQFVRCHKSYLVNLEHVTEVGRTAVRLDSGEEVPVGRKYAAETQSAFVAYLNR